MRFVHKTLAALLSTGCLLASTADARAQSCNDFSPQWKGNWQVQLGNNSCAPLTNVSVTVAVTQDIKVASSTDGYNGFSMQLNTNGPRTPSSGHLDAAQFVIRADTANAVDTPGVDAFTQLWPSSGLALVAPNPVPMGAPYTVDDTFLTIPAGTLFIWDLQVDGNDDIASCQFSAVDNMGTKYTTVLTTIPLQDRSPLYGLTMDIVGYNDGSYTTFQSGAGTITYEGTSFSPSYNPGGTGGCAYNFGTAENSNMVYGPLTGSGNTRTQTFSASETANFRSDDCEPSTPYPSGDWAYGDYKAECPLGAPLYGVSRIPGGTWSNDIECGMPQPAYILGVAGGSACYARAVEHTDDRGYTGDGDWDPGSYKTECKFGEYVAGVSQNAISGDLTSILCCPAPLVTHSSCDTQVFYNSDSPAMSTPPDWDPGNYKGQCPAGQYVAGISTPAYSSIGMTGAGHALLCCSQ